MDNDPTTLVVTANSLISLPDGEVTSATDRPAMLRKLVRLMTSQSDQKG